MDAASSSAQAPGRVELQQLRRKAQSALGRLSQQGGRRATEPLGQLQLGVGLDS